MNPIEPAKPVQTARGNKLAFLLLAPYAVLLWPGFYARWFPELFGFPFFYWFQFAWVILTAVLTALVSRSRRRWLGA